MFVDHYIVLGLPTGEEGMQLTERQIIQAYKARALEVHPDKRRKVEAGTAKIDFQRLLDSFQVLIDAQKRQDFHTVILNRQRKRSADKLKKGCKDFTENCTKMMEKVSEILKEGKKMMETIDAVKAEIGKISKQGKTPIQKIHALRAELDKISKHGKNTAERIYALSALSPEFRKISEVIYDLKAELDKSWKDIFAIKDELDKISKEGSVIDMEKIEGHRGNKLPYDVLLHIFSMVSLFDRLANVAGVCRSWRDAVSDPSLSSEILDLSEWRPQLNRLSLARQRAILNRAFVRGINMSLVSLRALDFGPYFQLKAKHLLYAASRCPNLQELVLPGLFRNSTEEELTNIFRQWWQLESITLGQNHERLDIFEIIGKNCPNLKVLDVCCHSLYRTMAVDILSCMPRLKVLKVHCEFDNDNLEFSTYKLFGLPELENITITVNNQPTKYYTRTSISEPWDIVIEGS